MTPDEARQRRAAEHHHEAMRCADEAHKWQERGRHDFAISCFLDAARHEFRAVSQIVMMDTPHEPTRSVFYRSAAALAGQASKALAEQGLRGEPDAQLRAELEELS